MKGNKILLVSLLAIFCLSIGAVCATDFDNDTVLSENQTNNNQNNLLIEEDLNQDNNLSNINQEELIEEDDILSKEQVAPNHVIRRDVVATAPAFKKYIETYGKLPNTVKVGNKIVSTSEYVRLMAFMIRHIHTLKSKAQQFISPMSVGPHKILKIELYLSYGEYNPMAGAIAYKSFDKSYYTIKKNHIYRIAYEVYAYGFASILDYVVNHNNTYPHYNVLFTSKPFLKNTDSINPTNSSGYDDYDGYIDYHKVSKDLNHANNDNVKSSNLENTGNPLLLLLFTLAMIPILRIKK